MNTHALTEAWAGAALAIVAGCIASIVAQGVLL